MMAGLRLIDGVVQGAARKQMAKIESPASRRAFR
jgi:hypothetical protein